MEESKLDLPSLSSSGETDPPSALNRDEVQHDNELLLRDLVLEDAMRIATNTSERRHDTEADLGADEGMGSQDDVALRKVFTHESRIGETQELDLPPDGGLVAWLCVLGNSLIMFSTWGANAGFGVFLEYYLNNDTFKGATAYDFALIGGIIVFFAQGLAPIAMMSVRLIGFRETLAAATVLQTVGYITASYAKTTWQLYLSQGVAVGVAFAFIFVPGIVVVPTYFLKRRAAAMGIGVSGSGIGGVVFSLAVDKVMKNTGDQKWALRMCGIVTGVACLIALCITKPRNYERPKHITMTKFKQQLHIIFDFSIAKCKPVIYITGWFSLAILGYIVLIFTMSSYATSVGLTSKQGSVLTAIMNAGQAIGRPSMGIIADKVGRVNFTLALTVFIFILIFSWWINATSYGSLIALSLFLGMSMGVGNVMNPVLTADSVEPRRFPAAWSFLNVICAIVTLVAEVIALALRNEASKKPYLNTQIFSGFMFVGGALFLLLLREWSVARYMRQVAYMKDNGSSSDEDDEKNITKNLDKYENLMRPGFSNYCMRMFYPMKI